MTLFERIKFATKKRGKTIRQVALEAGFNSESAIYRYNQGVNPREATLEAIARAIPTSVDFLKGKTDDWMIHADNNQNGNAISNEDLSQAVDNARSFDGKPITDNDKNIIKGILKGYFSQK